MQVSRSQKRDRDQRAYEAFKELVKQIHGRDAVEIAREAREKLVKVWETEHIYDCEIRARLRRAYNIHTSNANLSRLVKEAKTENESNPTQN